MARIAGYETPQGSSLFPRLSQWCCHRVDTFFFSSAFYVLFFFVPWISVPFSFKYLAFLTIFTDLFNHLRRHITPCQRSHK